MAGEEGSRSRGLELLVVFGCEGLISYGDQVRELTNLPEASVSSKQARESCSPSAPG